MAREALIGSALDVETEGLGFHRPGKPLKHGMPTMLGNVYASTGWEARICTSRL